MKLKCLIGNVYGMLTVVSRGNNDIHGSVRWNCKCECGNTKLVVGNSLKTHNGTRSCGCLSKTHFNDLTGKTFNELTIKRHIGKNKTNNNIYECVCSCNNTIIAEGSDVKVGKIRSCGCLRFKKAQLNCLKNPFDRIKKQIYNSYLGKCKKRNLPFLLSEEEFKSLLDKNCYYCGSEPINSSVVRNAITGDLNYRYNGVDRKINDLGYTKENAVTCCKICNMSKQSLNEEYFLEWIAKIYRYQFEKNKE